MNKIKRKILYITTRLPYPIIGGDRLRMYHILKQLKLQGHDITVVSLMTEDDSLTEAKKHNEFYTKLITIPFNKKTAYLNATKAIFNDKPFIVQYFYSNKMQKVIDNLLKENVYDVITGYMIRIAPYLEKHKSKNIIIDFVDAVSMMYKRRILTVCSLWDKFKIGIEYLKVKKYEKKCCKIFKKQTLISEYDKMYIESFADKFQLNIVPNGVDTEYFKPINCKKQNNICFVGSMQYIPNSEAAKYFATEIFPIIKKQIPDIKYKIIGANPRQELFDITKNIEGIEITGRVDDVREYMKDCNVSVCPVKIAGGVQNKILEAMSMGIPVITTPEGAEGIGADENILQIATTPQDYANKVIEIIKNNELREILSSKSREFILENFSWIEVGKKWNKLLTDVINE